MTRDDKTDGKPTGVNPGYAKLQLAKALTTAATHPKPTTRRTAQEKIDKWQAVFASIVAGTVDYGSNTPVAGIPDWATLEVVTGGFATGSLLAGGKLRKHEIKMANDLGISINDDTRLRLNTYYLSEPGLVELQNRLTSGCYCINVPEEGALLVVAWLMQNNQPDDARNLLRQLAPFFSTIRFYMVPATEPPPSGSRVHLENVGEITKKIDEIKPNENVLAQKEAAYVWAPVYDNIVALFLETVVDQIPCQVYPPDWTTRAKDTYAHHLHLKQNHKLCGKMFKRGSHANQLLNYLSQCAKDPRLMTATEINQIQNILNCYIKKRGKPGSNACTDSRERERHYVSAPTHHRIAQVVISRLQQYPKDEGIDSLVHLKGAVNTQETEAFNIPEAEIPKQILKKLNRCQNETVDVLVKSGIITSSESLAHVLPQVTAEVRAAGIGNPQLRQLYAGIYQAFRQRRSLLLLNLEKQIQLEQLPWIAVIESHRTHSLSSKESANQTLEEVCVLALTSFPHTIIPNKLVQELKALSKSAEHDIPLLEELAVDIFMGEFSPKYTHAAKIAANLLDQTLYSRYYGIDYSEIKNIETTDNQKTSSFARQDKNGHNHFAQICASRAGVKISGYDTVASGMIIEQQQIITTQNLATIFTTLDLCNTLSNRLQNMARHCFQWICQCLQRSEKSHHAQLITRKNSAYAWRQMVFYLALCQPDEVFLFIGWAERYLTQQKKEFQLSFEPAFNGLVAVTNGADAKNLQALHTEQVLGWVKRSS